MVANLQPVPGPRPGMAQRQAQAGPNTRPVSWGEVPPKLRMQWVKDGNVRRRVIRRDRRRPR